MIFKMNNLSGEPEYNDKKYTLKFVILTDVICFLIGFGFHYLVEDHQFPDRHFRRDES